MLDIRYLKFLFDEHIQRTNNLDYSCYVITSWAKNKPEVPLRVSDLQEVDILDIEKAKEEKAREAEEMANMTEPARGSFTNLTSIGVIVGIMSTPWPQSLTEVAKLLRDIRNSRRPDEIDTKNSSLCLGAYSEDEGHAGPAADSVAATPSDLRWRSQRPKEDVRNQ